MFVAMLESFENRRPRIAVVFFGLRESYGEHFRSQTSELPTPTDFLVEFIESPDRARFVWLINA